MTSSDFSLCCSIYSLTINIFESPPLEQHVFNCASHVVLSNAMKLSHTQSLFCSVDRGRRCEEHLVRALLVQRRHRQLAAVRRLQADGTQLQRPAGQGGAKIFLCQKATNCQPTRSGPATTATASLATTSCSTPVADLI